MCIIGGSNLHMRASPRWRRFGGNTTGGSMELNPDFKEFIESCNANGVRYLVVGGYAVALHGRPRYTKDLDIWVEPTPENAERMLRALEQFGFGSLNLRAADFLVPDQVIQLGVPPNRIDLLTTLVGVTFEACYAARQQTELSDVDVSFIDLENLKRNKRAAGRLQDLADVESLESGD
jgi:hypothetical protein